MNDELIDETLRLYRRYQHEIVEGLNLCPWAKRARLDGKVQPRVSLSQTTDPAPVLAAIDDWTANANIDIGLLIFPRLQVSRKQFEHFATDAMEADAKRHTLRSPQFVIAAFHPDAPLLTDSAERLIPFLRRTPDPTLQIVRVSALERVRQGETTGTRFVDLSTLDLSKLPVSPAVSLRDRVSASNLRTAEQLGERALLEAYERIARDHRETRKRLAQSDDSETHDAPD